MVSLSNYLYLSFTPTKPILNHNYNIKQKADSEECADNLLKFGYQPRFAAEYFTIVTTTRA